MKAAAKKKPEPAFEILDEVEQGSDEWLRVRLGIPTASNFAIVLRDGVESKTRDEYMRKLAGELLTGVPSEGGRKFVTAAMQRGTDMEPEALAHYERTTFGVELERVGFVRRKLPSGRYAGASPDALKAKRKQGVEIKTMAPHLMIERLERGSGMPPEHRAQVYGTMWIGELESVDLMLYYRGMPVAPRFTVIRNETEIKRISDAVQVFDHELHNMVERIRKMGR